MSDPAVLVARYIEAWNGDDVEARLAFTDPEVTIDWLESNAPWARIHTGHDGARKLFDEIRDSFDVVLTEPHEYVVVGRQVAVRNTAYLRGREGIEVVARSTIV